MPLTLSNGKSSCGEAENISNQNHPPQQLGGMFVVPFEVLIRDLHRIVEDAGKVIGCSWFELTYSKVKVFGEEHIINVVNLVI